MKDFICCTNRFHKIQKYYAIIWTCFKFHSNTDFQSFPLQSWINWKRTKRELPFVRRMCAYYLQCVSVSLGTNRCIDSNIFVHKCACQRRNATLIRISASLLASFLFTPQSFQWMRTYGKRNKTVDVFHFEIWKSAGRIPLKPIWPTNVQLRTSSSNSSIQFDA